MPANRQVKFDPTTGELVAVNAAGTAYVLTPPGSGGGESPSNYVVTTYTFTGAEGTDFFVDISEDMLNANYAVIWSPKGCPSGVIPTVDLPSGAGDRTQTQFRVQTPDGQQDAGDKVEFVCLARAVDSGMRVMIGAGQSNSIGLCQASAVTNYPSHDLTLPFSGANWFSHVAYSNGTPPTYVDQGPQTERPRTTSSGSYLAGMGGVFLVMAHELAENTSNTWFYGASAVDGSSIAQWNDPAQLRTPFVAFIGAQMVTAGCTDPGKVTVQFDQGEADIGAAYATYLAALQSLYAACAAAYPGIGWLTNRLSSKVDVVGNVRAAQEAFTRSTIGARIAYADDLALRDAAHYTNDSYVTLAERLSVQQIAAVEGDPPPEPDYTGAGAIVSADSSTALVPEMTLHKEGDWLLLILFAIGNTAYAIVDTNWVLVTAIHDNASGLNPRLQIWKRRCNGAPLTSPTIPDVGGDDFKFAFFTVIEGGDASNIVEDLDVATATTATAVSFPSGTSVGLDRMVMNIMAFSNDAVGQRVSNPTNALLTDLTQQVNYSNTASVGYSVFVSTGRLPLAGPSGNTLCNLTSTSPVALATLVLK